MPCKESGPELRRCIAQPAREGNFPLGARGRNLSLAGEGIENRGCKGGFRVGVGGGKKVL